MMHAISARLGRLWGLKLHPTAQAALATTATALLALAGTGIASPWMKALFLLTPLPIALFGLLSGTGWATVAASGVIILAVSQFGVSPFTYAVFFRGAPRDGDHPRR